MSTRTQNLKIISHGLERAATLEEASGAWAGDAGASAAAMRRSLEAFLLKLCSQIQQLPREQVEPEIEAALQRLTDFLPFERIWIGEFTDGGGGELQLACSVSRRPGTCLALRGSLSMQAPWAAGALRNGSTLSLPSIPDGLPQEAEAEGEWWIQQGVRSALAIPVDLRGKVRGAIGFCAALPGAPWPADLVAPLRNVGELLLQALVGARDEQRLASALAEIKSLRAVADEEMGLFSRAVPVISPVDRLNSHSAQFRALVSDLKQVALTDTTVLLVGETGTGKALLTQAIHHLSRRRDRPMVTVNCAALPSTLIEAELFGREKGAYTGALARQQGRFEAADGSTIFLDEIGELPLELQTKLLRVLQEGEFERVGSTKTIKVDARVIAATNRDLAEAVNEGSFRDDLYYRLNVFPIEVPPLRDRREDILMLAWSFIREFNQSMGRHIENIDESSIDALQRHSWPGNIRELRNTIERAMILTREKTLRVTIGRTAGVSRRLPAFATDGDRQHIMRTLEACRWRIRGPDGAAAALNIKPTTLESRMKRLGIVRSPSRFAASSTTTTDD